MKLMKGIVVTEKNVVKVANDIPVPELGPYDCLCRVRACGFCTGTDFGIIHGLTTAAQGFRGYPTVLGHEGAGEVVEVGEKVRHIKVGDRFIHPNLRPDVGNGYTKTYGGMAQFGLVCDQQAMVEDGVCKPEEVPFYKKQGRFSDKIDFVDAALLLSLCECHSAATTDSVPLVFGNDVKRLQSDPVGLMYRQIADILLSFPDQIHGIRRIIDPRQLLFAVPVPRKVVDHAVGIDPPVCGAPDPVPQADNGGHILAACPDKHFITSHDAASPCIHSVFSTYCGFAYQQRPLRRKPFPQNLNTFNPVSGS